MPLSRVAALRALVHKPCMPGLVFLPASCTNAASPKMPPDAQKASEDAPSLVTVKTSGEHMKRCVPTGFHIGALRVAQVPARASPLLRDTCSIAARKCRAAYRGTDSAKNRIFRQNDKLQCRASQRYPALAVAVDKSGKVQQITMVQRSNNTLFDALARTPFTLTGNEALRRPLCSGLSDGLFFTMDAHTRRPF